ncbi:MAG: hypothetical protein NWR72_07285 [Bacteroidia bacterium]|nr:hypothetical protein [Bacteroidia bacterium]
MKACFLIIRPDYLPTNAQKDQPRYRGEYAGNVGLSQYFLSLLLVLK